MKGRLLAAAALAFGLPAMAAVQTSAPDVRAAPPPRAAPQEKKRRQMTRSELSAAASCRRKGPGWTVAHVKRMARKRRNVLRHRAQCKGRKRK